MEREMLIFSSEMKKAVDDEGGLSMYMHDNTNKLSHRA